MTLNLLLGLMLMMPQAIANQIPKNNPNGVWQAESGSKYNIHLSGDDLKVTIVPNSNPKFLQYEVNLTLLGAHDKEYKDDPNTYKGPGFFVAKMEGGKECKVDIEWQVTVVQPGLILGSATNAIVDSKTCDVRDKSQVQLSLKRAASPQGARQ